MSRALIQLEKSYLKHLNKLKLQNKSKIRFNYMLAGIMHYVGSNTPMEIALDKFINCSDSKRKDAVVDVSMFKLSFLKNPDKDDGNILTYKLSEFKKFVSKHIKSDNIFNNKVNIIELGKATFSGYKAANVFGVISAKIKIIKVNNKPA